MLPYYLSVGTVKPGPVDLEGVSGKTQREDGRRHQFGNSVHVVVGGSEETRFCVYPDSTGVCVVAGACQRRECASRPVFSGDRISPFERRDQAQFLSVSSDEQCKISHAWPELAPFFLSAIVRTY